MHQVPVVTECRHPVAGPFGGPRAAARITVLSGSRILLASARNPRVCRSIAAIPLVSGLTGVAPNAKVQTESARASESNPIQPVPLQAGLTDLEIVVFHESGLTCNL